MEFTLNPHFEGDDRCSAFSLSDKHRVKLAVLLLGWESSLPTGVRHYISRVEVKLDSRFGKRIEIGVHLTGDYRAHAEHLPDETRIWKSSFAFSVPYQSSYCASLRYEPSFCKDVPQELTAMLQKLLEREVATLEQPKKLFTLMLKSLREEKSEVSA